jgi:DNA polymerase-3 subunit epsilon
VRLARKLLPDLPRRNLDTVSYHFGIEIEGRHRAVGDAVAAAKCLKRLLSLAQTNGATSLAALHSL